MKRNTTIIVVTVLTIGFVAITPNVDASSLSDLAVALQVFAEGQAELIYQNDRLIEQNDDIIELLKGNHNIFVPGLTDRYDVLEYRSYGECTFYDRLERDIKTETCPITGLTKDQFNAMINAKPES